MGVAKGFQLLHSVGAAASGAAVHQPQGVFVRQHLGGAVDDLPQRQQLCPRDVPNGVFVRLAHIHCDSLAGIQQTDGVCGSDLFCHTLTPQR